jgi:hypothetical protein
VAQGSFLCALLTLVVVATLKIVLSVCPIRGLFRKSMG